MLNRYRQLGLNDINLVYLLCDLLCSIEIRDLSVVDPLSRHSGQERSTACTRRGDKTKKNKFTVVFYIPQIHMYRGVLLTLGNPVSSQSLIMLANIMALFEMYSGTKLVIMALTTGVLTTPAFTFSITSSRTSCSDKMNGYRCVYDSV